MASPQPLHDRAIENLRFIRDTMARAGAFTAVPGKGQVALGATALVAALLAHRAPSRLAWLEIWLGEALVALAIGAWSMVRKARVADDALLSGPGRRVLLSFFPALLAGGLLTASLFAAGTTDPLPGLWLLLYGTGV